MTRYVAFLRAINVGGRRLSMDKLAATFEALGFDNVSTYIASGNVIFEAADRPAELEPRIEANLAEQLGYQVETFVRTGRQLAQIVGLDPFPHRREGDTHMVGFLAKRPAAATKRAVESLSGDADELALHGREVHWLIHGKMMDSKVGGRPLEKALGGQAMTTRNVTMLRKLVAKLNP